MRTLIIGVSFVFFLSASLVNADTVTISKETPFTDDSGASDNVKRECKLEERLPKYIKSYAKKHSDVVFTTDSLDSVEGKTLHLEIDHVFAPGGGGYSGAKTVSVVGELRENGEVIASLTADRAAIFSMTPGTCSMLKRAVKKLGQDIGAWLETPEMDSMLGDAAT